MAFDVRCLAAERVGTWFFVLETCFLRRTQLICLLARSLSRNHVGLDEWTTNPKETESSPPQESGAILLFPPATDPPDSGSRCPVEEQLLLSHNLNAAISVIVADAEHAATLGSLATTLTATAVKLKTRISEPVAGVAREGKGELTSSGGGGVNFFTGKDAILRSTAGSNGGRLSPDAIEVNVDAASGAGVGEGDVGGLENIRGLKPLTSLSPPRPPPSSHTTAENVQSSSSSSRSSSSDANNLDMKGNVADNDCPPVVIVVGHQDGKDMLSWIQGFAPTTSNVGKSLADGGVGRFGKNEPTGGENIVGAGVIIARLVEQEDVPRLWEDVAWASDARNWPTGGWARAGAGVWFEQIGFLLDNEKYSWISISAFDENATSPFT